jgi:hypothetical protein
MMLHVHAEAAPHFYTQAIVKQSAEEAYKSLISHLFLSPEKVEQLFRTHKAS